jgi:anti-sigma B factor antagonist
MFWGAPSAPHFVFTAAKTIQSNPSRPAPLRSETLSETAQQKSAVRVIEVAGHVRMGELVDRLRSDIDSNLSAGNNRLVLNMTNLKSLDSSGIGVIVRSLGMAKKDGGSIKLANVPEGVTQSLQVTGIWRLFEVFKTDQEAIASFCV